MYRSKTGFSFATALLIARGAFMAFLVQFAGGALAADAGAGPGGFRLPVLGGAAEVSLADVRGKVVYLDFWASWCGPCRKAIPLYETMYREIGTEHFEILAINLDENEQDALEFLEQRQITYPVLLDPAGATALDWGVRVMPTSFLLDREGRIVREFPGFETSHFAEIRHEIETLLAQ